VARSSRAAAVAPDSRFPRLAGTAAVPTSAPVRAESEHPGPDERFHQIESFNPDECNGDIPIVGDETFGPD